MIHRSCHGVSSRISWKASLSKLLCPRPRAAITSSTATPQFSAQAQGHWNIQKIRKKLRRWIAEFVILCSSTSSTLLLVQKSSLAFVASLLGCWLRVVDPMGLQGHLHHCCGSSTEVGKPIQRLLAELLGRPLSLLALISTMTQMVVSFVVHWTIGRLTAQPHPLKPALAAARLLTCVGVAADLAATQQMLFALGVAIQCDFQALPLYSNAFCI